MTGQAFRRLALSMPEAFEAGHMGHPDFRVGGKIFATLGHPDGKWGMVKLTPEQQEAFVTAEPSVFVAVKGAWGRGGATNVLLRAAKVASLRVALGMAQRRSPRTLQKGQREETLPLRAPRAGEVPMEERSPRPGSRLGAGRRGTTWPAVCALAMKLPGVEKIRRRVP